jgi:glycosyltransferase involved in cell wall biosynthesis
VKISVLTPNLSNNCLGRAWLLAKILQRHYEVEIIGPMFGSSIWEPVQSEFPYVGVAGYSFPKFIPEIYKMLKKTKGDVIYASKPLFTSFTIGLMKKHIAKRTLVLDIDDWELPLCIDYVGKRCVLHPNSYWTTILNERLTCLADEVTVSNTFLQRKFGGKIVHHARDTDHLDPLKYDGVRLKERFGVTGKMVITFLGSPRPHKGLEDLIKAVAMLKDKRIILMVVGPKEGPYYQNFRTMMEESLLKERVLDLGIQPIRDVPKFLSFTDLVVIPQRNTPASIAQIPARVFDAMAMARPIIATKVSELPEILDNCGWVVDPENPGKLAQSIQYVFDHPAQAEEMGWKARQRCIEKYSWDAMEKVLAGVFGKYQ